MDCDCMEHTPHLVVVSSLLLADDMLRAHQKNWKYWSSLAVFANTAREVAGSLYDSYSAHFGFVEAKAVKTIMPRAVSQRWNRIHELENRVLKAGCFQLAVCLADVLARKDIDSSELAALERESGSAHAWGALNSIRNAVTIAKQRKTDTPAEPLTHSKVNEPALEEAKEYSIRMSRWRGQTLRTVADQMWGRMIAVMQACRGPIVHFSFFIKRESTASLISDTSKSNELSAGALATLVYGKAAEIHNEFGDLQRDAVAVSVF